MEKRSEKNDQGSKLPLENCCSYSILRVILWSAGRVVNENFPNCLDGNCSFVCISAKMGICDRFDTPSLLVYASPRPGRPGAAEPPKPRQDRKIATVRKRFWVPPVP